LDVGNEPKAEAECADDQPKRKKDIAWNADELFAAQVGQLQRCLASQMYISSFAPAATGGESKGKDDGDDAAGSDSQLVQHGGDHFFLE